VVAGGEEFSPGEHFRGMVKLEDGSDEGLQALKLLPVSVPLLLSLCLR